MASFATSKDANDTFISSLKSKRLFKDIIDIEKNPLTKEGIFYIHDYDNIEFGYAAIVGPKNTPYENGVYLFKFKFKSSYPYEPPVLTYLTNDGKTRFNPNLYRSGKVCISILNTWKGERWSACQSIRSVLVMLVTVLNEEPFLNEPGIKKTNKEYSNYNDIINYKNYEVAIFNNFNKYCKSKHKILSIPKTCSDSLKEFMISHFVLKRDEISTRFEELRKQFHHKDNSKIYKVSLYGMSTEINYNKLLKDFSQFLID